MACLSWCKHCHGHSHHGRSCIDNPGVAVVAVAGVTAVILLPGNMSPHLPLLSENMRLDLAAHASPCIPRRVGKSREGP